MNGIDYFYTDDTIGVSPVDKKRVGPCVFGLTGFNNHQGRIASVGYAVKHCVMPVDYDKFAVTDFVLDVRRVDKQKLKLFATAIPKWFEQCVWTDTDAANNYLRVVGELCYKIYDVSINVSKDRGFFENTKSRDCYKCSGEISYSLSFGQTIDYYRKISM